MSRSGQSLGPLRSKLLSFCAAFLVVVLAEGVISAQPGPQSRKINIDRLRAGAETGQVGAQIDLARALEFGVGTTADPAEAARWFLAAANQGHPGAQTTLGYLYALGVGVAQDEELAFRWFQRAAAEGYAQAQNDLGAMYSNGVGTKADPAAAMVWFRRAAEQGF